MSARGRAVTRTDSESSDFGNVLRTSRKLAAARNFLAVALGQDELRLADEKGGTPVGVTSPILVVRHGKDTEGKVLDIGSTDGFDVYGVVWANFPLHALEGAEEGQEDVAGRGIPCFERDAQLCGIVRACGMDWLVDGWGWMSGTYTSMRRWGLVI